MLGSPWNSLEITKLIVSALTPLFLLGLGILVNRGTHRLEEAEWRHRKLVDRRLDVYDAMAPALNDLYCFFRLRGHFKSIAPPRVVELKRELDKLFHVSRFLFDPEFARAYEQFIDACFATYTGSGEDAKLRGLPEEHRRERGTWDPAWNGYFEPSRATPLGEIDTLYLALMNTFASQLGVTAPAEEHATRAR